jgi:hypothetical protein
MGYTLGDRSTSSLVRRGNTKRTLAHLHLFFVLGHHSLCITTFLSRFRISAWIKAGASFNLGTTDTQMALGLHEFQNQQGHNDNESTENEKSEGWRKVFTQAWYSQDNVSPDNLLSFCIHTFKVDQGCDEYLV